MRVMMLALCAVLFLCACDSGAATAGAANGNADPTRQLAIVAADGRRHTFRIELALTPQQQANGLMGRTEMAADAGMLFYFGQEEPRSFWMKNTLIPLDMVFIHADGRIARVHDSAKPNDLTSVPSGAPVAAVLELNGGTANRLGIREGDRAYHPFFTSEQ